MTYQQRPSDHTRSNRLHWHGRILPMQEQDWNIWRLDWLRKERSR